MATPRADIDPSLLRWARESIGYSVEEAAAKTNLLGVSSASKHGRRARGVRPSPRLLARHTLQQCLHVDWQGTRRPQAEWIKCFRSSRASA